MVKSNKKVDTEMFIQNIYITIMNNPIMMYSLRKLLNQLKKIYLDLDKEMEGSGFSLKFVSN